MHGAIRDYSANRRIAQELTENHLVGESWAYYWLYGVIEIAVTVGAVVLAVKWPKEAIVNEQ
jgi:hypothetical protein